MGRPAPPGGHRARGGQLVPSTRTVLTVPAALAREALETKQREGEGSVPPPEVAWVWPSARAPLGAWGVTALGSFPSISGDTGPVKAQPEVPPTGSLSKQCDGTCDLQAPLSRPRSQAAGQVPPWASDGAVTAEAKPQQWRPLSLPWGADPLGTPGIWDSGWRGGRSSRWRPQACCWWHRRKDGGIKAGSASVPWTWGAGTLLVSSPPSPPS